jgi:molybdopterin adenylyltransferase
MSHLEHQPSSPISARCAIVTLSDTRTAQQDKSGARIRQFLEGAGHAVAFYQVIRDEPSELDALLVQLKSRDDIDLIITNGGTGISPRDQTVPVIERHLTAPLPGFGELFRMLSFQEIGSAAMLSRALGGVSGNKLLFALPGSTAAVELAMTRLILPELGHMLQL